ncbi:MAG: putative transposase [Natrialbaceae archaeon]|jgi:putative transposase
MDDDAPRRTVPIKLDGPEERRGDLHQTKTQFLQCANRTSEWAWRYDDYCITSKSKAEDALYDELREETDLTANLVQKGIRRAIEAVDSGVEKLKKGERDRDVGHGGWLFDQALDAAQAFGQREHLGAGNQRTCFLERPVEFEAEHAAEVVHLAGRHVVARMGLEAGEVHVLDVGIPRPGCPGIPTVMLLSAVYRLHPC